METYKEDICKCLLGIFVAAGYFDFVVKDQSISVDAEEVYPFMLAQCLLNSVFKNVLGLTKRFSNTRPFSSCICLFFCLSSFSSFRRKLYLDSACRCSIPPMERINQR